jgi:uncharacterized membrane protein
MEVLFILLVIGFIIAPIAALVIAQDARSKVRSLETQLNQLRALIANQAEALNRLSKPSQPAAERDVSVASAPQTPWSPPPETVPAKAPEKPVESEKPAATNLGEWMAQAGVDAPKPAAAVPPPLPAPAKSELEKLAPPPTLAHSKPAATPSPVLPKINLEQFMGAKMFAWIGGLAMFLGILFFVKLSFERGWIPPSLRILIGYILGLVLLVVGALTNRSKLHAVLGQTLCGTGIVVLYGVSFAGHALYKIAPLDSAPVTFLIMSLVTLTAFILAVRMNAMVVAVLGMLGGFLTPPLDGAGPALRALQLHRAAGHRRAGGGAAQALDVSHPPRGRRHAAHAGGMAHQVLQNLWLRLWFGHVGAHRRVSVLWPHFHPGRGLDPGAR